MLNILILLILSRWHKILTYWTFDYDAKTREKSWRGATFTSVHVFNIKYIDVYSQYCIFVFRIRRKNLLCSSLSLSIFVRMSGVIGEIFIKIVKIFWDIYHCSIFRTHLRFHIFTLFWGYNVTGWRQGNISKHKICNFI